MIQGILVDLVFKEYVTLSQFAFVMLGVSLLLLVSTLTSNLGFKALDPYHDGDKGGPYFFQWCPRTIFNFDADEDSELNIPQCPGQFSIIIR